MRLTSRAATDLTGHRRGGVWHTFGRKEHKPCDVGSRRHRTTQRDGPPGEPERDRPRAPRRVAPLSRSELVGRDRPDPQRDPRPGRRARRERPRRRGARRVRRGTPGRPSPVVRLEPDGGVGPRARDRGRLARRGRSSGSVARSSTRCASTGRAASTRVDDVVARPRRTGGRPPAADDPPRDRSASASRSSGSSGGRDGRGLDGAEPRLGRRRRSATRWPRRSAIDVPIAVANDGDLGALAEHRRGPRVGVDDVLFISGEVGVGGGHHRRRPAADRRRRLRRRGRPHAGQPGGPPCRCGSIGCWETEVGESRAAGAGRPPARRRPRRRSTRCCARPRPGSPVALRALEHVGRWLGIGLAGLVNVLNPRLDRARRAASAGSIRSSARTVEAELDRRALAAPRATGPDRPGDARRRRAAARRRRARDRATPRRPGGMAGHASGRELASA